MCLTTRRRSASVRRATTRARSRSGRRPADRDRHVGWARGYADALAPYATGGYVNYLGDDASSADVAEAYGRSRYERLVALKDAYDPTNMFRFNQNVLPTARS